MKLNHKRVAENLTKEIDDYAEKVPSLLSEKSDLITKCDFLGANVKELQIEVSDLESTVCLDKEELTEKENAWIVEKRI